MSSPHVTQVVIVLFQPQDVVNVAAVIRLMSNFGLPQLRLVEPAAFDPYRIEGIAHGTRRLIASTQRFPTLAEALSDCTLVLGTSGRPRQAERRVLAPRQAAAVLLEAGATAPDRKVAVLFGREQDGLPNEALDLCHGMITIPTHPDNRSLNLAQAALVIAYEIWMGAQEQATSQSQPEGPDLADGAQRESMFAASQEMLLALYPTSPAVRVDGAMARLRTILLRSEPRSAEAEALANLFRHAARRLRGTAGQE